ncbi:MAG: ABC transporter permease subunit [Proteobacteria bacterium]|nr:ABC transporter permease subunit [Pseudomonadota bacterium]NIS72329.1 ABC transporter permease subunit [Pseudomonadota bacterium]
MQSKFPSRLLPYLLLSPSIVIVIVFLIIPSLQSLYLSFFRVSPFGDRLIYVAIDNFTNLLTPDYLNSFIVTVVFTGAVVVVGLVVCLALALAANQKVAGIGLYRTGLIWPYALSPAVAGTIWALVFDPSTGAFSYFISLASGAMPNWRTNGPFAVVVITLAATWKMVGYNVIFFLAGLQTIPRELIEAAEIDGAGPLKRFWNITFPLLSPMTLFLLIMNTLYGFFQVFGLIDVMTEGGPARATEVLVYKLYYDGFISLKTGYASAQSIVLFAFVAGLTLLQFRFAKRWVFYQ